MFRSRNSKKDGDAKKKKKGGGQNKMEKAGKMKGKNTLFKATFSS